MDITHLLTLILATWRLSHLIANDDILPVLEKLRSMIGVRYNEQSNRYGTNWLAKQVLCQWCNTLWIGVTLAICYWLWPVVTFYICLPFAISTGAILVLISRPMMTYWRKR